MMISFTSICQDRLVETKKLYHRNDIDASQGRLRHDFYISISRNRFTAEHEIILTDNIMKLSRKELHFYQRYVVSSSLER